MLISFQLHRLDRYIGAHARRHQVARAGGGRPDRLGHRGGPGAALLAALGQPPPGQARSGDRREAGPAGRARDPADRGGEILGRLDAAATELAAHVGLRQGRVRLAAFPSALGTFVPAAASRLAAEHPGLELRLVETEPPEAVRMLRAGHVDAAVIFRYQDGADEDGIRTRPLLAEPTCLVTTDGGRDLGSYRDATWIAGCERCRIHLLDMCALAGFRPRIAYTTDDYVAVQSLVAAGLGVTTLPQLALAAARHPGVQAVPLPDSTRHVMAASYGEPPDPPGTAALLDALADAASQR